MKVILKWLGLVELMCLFVAMIPRFASTIKPVPWRVPALSKPRLTWVVTSRLTTVGFKRLIFSAQLSAEATAVYEQRSIRVQ